MHYQQHNNNNNDDDDDDDDDEQLAHCVVIMKFHSHESKLPLQLQVMHPHHYIDILHICFLKK